MRFRTKIYLSFFVVSTLSILGGIVFLYDKAADSLRFELKTKVISVAATTAALINTKDVEDLANSLDPKSPAFYRLQQQLLEVRDSNRRPDLFIKFIYLLKPTSVQDRTMIFLIEAQNTVLPGQQDLQQSQSKIETHLNELYSPSQFITDQFGIWMSGFAPIVDEHGNYLATIGVDISAASVDKTLNYMLKFAGSALIISMLTAYFIAYYLAHKMTTTLDQVKCCLDEVAKGNFQTHIQINSNDEFGKLSQTINHMIQGLQEREALKASFSRYVSTYVMDQILKDHSQLNLQGERKKITVLFSDIRHFTQISENLSPEHVVALLNEYFEVMLKLVFKHQGTIDKFMGDGLMVEFGAPLPDSEQQIHAVRCGLDMLEALKTLNERFVKQNRPTLDIGIGIHTGYAIMGNIGSLERMEYTAIGDCVNVASRLEQATKTYHHPLLVSEETFLALRSEFHGESIGSIALPGRSKQITVYAIKT